MGLDLRFQLDNHFIWIQISIYTFNVKGKERDTTEIYLNKGCQP